MSTNQPLRRKTVAFFDVDGTIVKSTIVHYYVWLRFPMLHPILRLFWLTHFIPKVIYYYILDKTSRTKFNMGSISQQVTLTEIALRIYRCCSVSIMRSPSIRAGRFGTSPSKLAGIFKIGHAASNPESVAFVSGNSYRDEKVVRVIRFFESLLGTTFPISCPA
ncbi:MAG: hypothetical protein OXN17_10095 [Candidatus Poribacteria bacterium]|nr:hypothetical protein [Candidatus Poribacteria bacterium]MDE0504058.1 hypothetical protein [Candidatus Poribacteria bacterium]